MLVTIIANNDAGVYLDHFFVINRHAVVFSVWFRGAYILVYLYTADMYWRLFLGVSAKLFRYIGRLVSRLTECLGRSEQIRRLPVFRHLYTHHSWVCTSRKSLQMKALRYTRSGKMILYEYSRQTEIIASFHPWVMPCPSFLEHGRYQRPIFCKITFPRHF